MLDVVHNDGYTELDYHSLFGTQEVKATSEWFSDYKKRPVIIERSAYAGMGKYGSRWLGDNNADTGSMGRSVTGIMMHNIFGIPLAGADICGFGSSTTPELCARWHVLGAFYPFSRNHNANDNDPQEPWVFKKDIYEGQTSYLDIMRMAIRTKYNLIRYYYTQLSKSSNEGGAFYKPVFFEFPEDSNAYLDPHNNVMLGDALKLSVLSNAVEKNETTFYFPAGTWCNIYNITDPCFNAAGPRDYSSKAYAFQLHFREGYIVPLQDARGLGINTTRQL